MAGGAGLCADVVTGVHLKGGATFATLIGGHADLYEVAALAVGQEPGQPGVVVLDRNLRFPGPSDRPGPTCYLLTFFVAGLALQIYIGTGRDIVQTGRGDEVAVAGAVAGTEGNRRLFIGDYLFVSGACGYGSDAAQGEWFSSS